MTNEGLVNTVINAFPEASAEQIDDIILRASNKPGDISRDEITRVAVLFKDAHSRGKTICSFCDHEASHNLLCESCNEVAERQASRA